MTTAAKDLAGAAIGVGVFGVGPVAAMLVADEVERSRCGIGCVLEKENGKFVVQRTLSSANQTDAINGRLEPGDIILKVDEHWLHSYHTIQEVSGMIRGVEGTAVTLMVSKWRSVHPENISIVRRRLPGAKAEMLGALWQGPSASPKKAQPLTLEDKLGKLDELKARGNLSEAEYETAQVRLREGRITARAQPARSARLPSPFEIADALSGDLQKFMGVHREQAVAIVSERLVNDLASVSPVSSPKPAKAWLLDSQGTITL